VATRCRAWDLTPWILGLFLCVCSECWDENLILVWRLFKILLANKEVTRNLNCVFCYDYFWCPKRTLVCKNFSLCVLTVKSCCKYRYNWSWLNNSYLARKFDKHLEAEQSINFVKRWRLCLKYFNIRSIQGELFILLDITCNVTRFARVTCRILVSLHIGLWL
jgi:hypothetical protein